MAEKKPKNPSAVAMARLRSRKLSPERRKEIAKAAAESRWKKQRIAEALKTVLFRFVPSEPSPTPFDPKELAENQTFKRLTRPEQVVRLFHDAVHSRLGMSPNRKPEKGEAARLIVMSSPMKVTVPVRIERGDSPTTMPILRMFTKYILPCAVALARELNKQAKKHGGLWLLCGPVVLPCGETGAVVEDASTGLRLRYWISYDIASDTFRGRLDAWTSVVLGDTMEPQ